MKIKELIITLIITFTFAFQVVAYANPADGIPDIMVYTVYANCETPIYEEKSVGARILDVSNVNTTFDAVEDDGEWTTILGEDGFAYIYSEDLRTEEVIEEVIEEEVEHSYTDEDFELMARVISGEAQFCDDDEQRYVGSVVLNRVADGRFPSTIRDVVYQKGQYACIGTRNWHNPTASNWANAKYVLENGAVLPVSVVWQSKARQGKGIYIQTKYHKYCY